MCFHYKVDSLHTVRVFMEPSVPMLSEATIVIMNSDDKQTVQFKNATVSLLSGLSKLMSTWTDKLCLQKVGAVNVDDDVRSSVSVKYYNCYLFHTN